jgi:hypothetical protein
MSLFPDIRTYTGPVPAELLERGRAGLGTIVSVQQTEVSLGRGLDRAHVCVFTVEVALSGRLRYTATCRQAVRASVLTELMLPGATVAVRVDPHDRSRIALSLDEAPPTERRAIRA